MTVKESRQLRREHVDGDIRSTANLFGTRDSGAILFRPVPTASGCATATLCG